MRSRGAPAGPVMRAYAGRVPLPHSSPPIAGLGQQHGACSPNPGWGAHMGQGKAAGEPGVINAWSLMPPNRALIGVSGGAGACALGCDCQGGVVFPPWQDPLVELARYPRRPAAPSCSTEVRVYPITVAGRGSGGTVNAWPPVASRPPPTSAPPTPWPPDHTPGLLTTLGASRPPHPRGLPL